MRSCGCDTALSDDRHAFCLEPSESWSLSWSMLIQRFAYRQIMCWVVVRSFVAAVRGHIVGWGTLARKGTVTVSGAAART